MSKNKLAKLVEIFKIYNLDSASPPTSPPIVPHHHRCGIFVRIKSVSLIVDLLFPKRCVGCGSFGSYFCTSCIGNIKQRELFCPMCEKSSVGGQTHPVCKRAWGLDGLWSLGVYQKPLRGAVSQFKYRLVQDLAPTLGDLVLEYWARYQPFLLDKIKKDRGANWVIVPVPLYISRQNWRGFNQSSVIGQYLSKKMGLSYCGALKRNRYTKPQVKLKGKDRRKNIFGAFMISDSSFLSSNPNILLIDDVWTTGSTLKECSKILKRQGAREVWALTLAN